MGSFAGLAAATAAAVGLPVIATKNAGILEHIGENGIWIDNVTLHHPLRVQKVKPEIPEVEAYAISGTPGDCVIMAISKLSKNEIGLVISGINNGPNTGDDVLISGTVGGAIQAYWHGHSAIAVSVNEIDSKYIDNAAQFTTLLVEDQILFRKLKSIS